jgi:hypothetical protein
LETEEINRDWSRLADNHKEKEMTDQKSKAKVVIETGRKSDEDPATIERVLGTLPTGWTFARDHLPFLGLLWEWDKDGWLIFDASGTKVASIYADGRSIQVYGKKNVQLLEHFANHLAEALDCQIRVSVA